MVVDRKTKKNSSRRVRTRRNRTRRNRIQRNRNKHQLRTKRVKRQSGGVPSRSKILKSRDKSRRSVIKKTRRLNSRSTRVTRKTMREAVPETINLFGNTIIRTLNMYEPFISQPLPLINAKPGPGIDSAYSIVNALYLIGKGWCAAAVIQSVRVVVKILTCVFIQITDSVIQSLSKRFRHPQLAKLLRNAWEVAKWTVGVMGVAAPLMNPLPDSGGKASYVDTQFLCVLDYLNEIKDRMLEDGRGMEYVLESGYSEAITQACAMYYHNSVNETVKDYNAYIDYLETHPSMNKLMHYHYHNEQLQGIRQRIEGIAVSLIPAGNPPGQALANDDRPDAAAAAVVADDGAAADASGLLTPVPESPRGGANSLSLVPANTELVPIQQVDYTKRPYLSENSRPPVLKDTRRVPARRRGMAGIAKKLNDLVEINERCQHTDKPVDVWKPDEWFRGDNRTYLEVIFKPGKTSKSVLAIEDKKPSSSKKKKKKSKKNKKTSSKK